MHVIGIDVGSQSVKALLTDESGAVLATASAPLTMAHPHDGWAEQDPASWEARDRGVGRARRASRPGCPAPTSGCSGSPARSTGWSPSATDLRPLRPAIIWLDRRAGRQTDALAAAAGAEPLTARTGLQPDSSHTAPKAMWLRDEEPEHYRAARWLAPVGGHLTGWLTGEVVQDHANASSTLVYDVHTRAWNDELVGHAGLDADKLPPIRASHEVAGSLRPEAAEAMGLSTAARSSSAPATSTRRRSAPARSGPGSSSTSPAPPSPSRSRRTRRSSTTRASSRRTRTRPTASLLVENPGFVSGGSTRWLAETQRISQARGLRARRRGAARRRRCAVRPRAVGLDGAALERPDARRVRRAGDEPRRRAPRPRGARGLHVRAARHRRPLRRARPRRRRDPRRRRWRPLAALAADQGRRHGLPRATGRGRRRDERRRRDARRRRGGQLRRPRRAAAEATVRLAPEPVLPDPATADVYADALRRATGGCSTRPSRRSRDASGRGGRARPRRRCARAWRESTTGLRPIGLGGVLLGAGALAERAGRRGRRSAASGRRRRPRRPPPDDGEGRRRLGRRLDARRVDVGDEDVRPHADAATIARRRRRLTARGVDRERRLRHGDGHRQGGERAARRHPARRRPDRGERERLRRRRVGAARRRREAHDHDALARPARRRHRGPRGRSGSR